MVKSSLENHSEIWCTHSPRINGWRGLPQNGFKRHASWRLQFVFHVHLYIVGADGQIAQSLEPSPLVLRIWRSHRFQQNRKKQEGYDHPSQIGPLSNSNSLFRCQEEHRRVCSQTWAGLWIFGCSLDCGLVNLSRNTKVDNKVSLCLVRLFCKCDPLRVWLLPRERFTKLAMLVLKLCS